MLSSTDTLCFIALIDVVFHKLKAGPSTSKRIKPCFIAAVWNQTCNISEICLYQETTVLKLSILSTDPPEESTKERASEGQSGSADTGWQGLRCGDVWNWER